jgi:hypothetical protein
VEDEHAAIPGNGADCSRRHADADDSPVVAVLGTNVVQEQDLADTGPREVMLLVTAAAAIIGLGIALRGAERRLLPA